MTLKNFSIILPGGCNARCGFCDDRGEKDAPVDYLVQLENAIATLPDDFTQVSITGGETSISPWLEPVLEVVADSLKFDKVVLTTNGSRILNNLFIFEYIDHLNISRHAASDEDNVKIFGTKAVLKSDRYKEVTSAAHKLGVDVNLNIVYTDESGWDYDNFTSFMSEFSELGVDKFTLRYDQRENSLDETCLEKQFNKHEVIHRGGCPVCRSHTVLIDGRPLTFKASFDEPAQALKGSEGLYELVFHENGVLSEDWSKSMPVEKVIKKYKKREVYTESEKDILVKLKLKTAIAGE